MLIKLLQIPFIKKQKKSPIFRGLFFQDNFMLFIFSGIEISLFKYPQSLIEAIIDDPPDVLALSNYSWNSNLSERICEIAKEIKPEIITVQGGTNFPHKKREQLIFLLNRPNTDIHVELESEVSFSNLIA